MQSLMDETTEVQARLKAKAKSNSRNEVEQNQKAFVRLGKIGDAAKKINNEDAVKGVHQLSEEIKNILQEKHPEGKNPVANVLLPQSNKAPEL